MLRRGRGRQQQRRCQGSARRRAKKLEAVYSYPVPEPRHHGADERHGPLDAERCEVWAPTQNGEAALAATIEAAGLPPRKCEVYKLHARRRLRPARRHRLRAPGRADRQGAAGHAVKLIWTREEDMTHGRYHPITQCKMTAGLDAQGNVTALHMRISGQSILATVAPQNIQNGKDPVVFQGLNPARPGRQRSATAFPNLLIDHAMRNPHVPAGFWRGVNLNQNTIYLESFIDEIAHATGRTRWPCAASSWPTIPKHLAVLNAVAERGGWGKPAPDVNGQKVFRGLAQCMGFGSYVAGCAEISVTADGASRSTASSPPPTRATPSTRSRSKRRSKARSSMACRRRCMANAR
jgi:isoquinoline 1-oxidoreductase beta subunit